ncbi:MAG: hypothetical protein KBS64_08260 [Treponema sp.]|nr:hypothetical protein [Candidatus Treponema equi]
MIKSKTLMLASVFAAASFLMISCGSAPEPAPAPVEETPAEETVQEPVAEDTNDTSDDSETTDKIASLWDSIDSLRQDAIDSGADKAAPDAFKAAEDEYNKLKNGDASEEELLALKARYTALKAFADAKAKKEKIDTLGLASYNQTVYDEGAALIEELSGDNNLTSADWGTKAVAANGAMTAVLETGLRAKAREEREAAVEAQKKANSVKCYVSRKAEYETYVNAFKSGDQKFVTKNPEGALEKYTKAKNGFMELYTTVSDARAKAQVAIDEAKKRVAASENTALQADIDKPLGDEPVEGIEDADTKLLEDDDFSEAASAEVDLTAEETPAEDLVEKIESGVNSVLDTLEAK